MNWPLLLEKQSLAQMTQPSHRALEQTWGARGCLLIFSVAILLIFIDGRLASSISLRKVGVHSFARISHTKCLHRLLAQNAGAAFCAIKKSHQQSICKRPASQRNPTKLCLVTLDMEVAETRFSIGRLRVGSLQLHPPLW